MTQKFVSISTLSGRHNVNLAVFLCLTCKTREGRVVAVVRGRKEQPNHL